jgi:hypothetical protein
VSTRQGRQAFLKKLIFSSPASRLLQIHEGIAEELMHEA